MDGVCVCVSECREDYNTNYKQIIHNLKAAKVKKEAEFQKVQQEKFEKDLAEDRGRTVILDKKTPGRLDSVGADENEEEDEQDDFGDAYESEMAEEDDRKEYEMFMAAMKEKQLKPAAQ